MWLILLLFSSLPNVALLNDMNPALRKRQHTTGELLLRTLLEHLFLLGSHCWGCHTVSLSHVACWAHRTILVALLLFLPAKDNCKQPYYTGVTLGVNIKAFNWNYMEFLKASQNIPCLQATKEKKKLTAFLIGILELFKVNTAPGFVLPQNIFLWKAQSRVLII